MHTIWKCEKPSSATLVDSIEFSYKLINGSSLSCYCVITEWNAVCRTLFFIQRQYYILRNAQIQYIWQIKVQNYLADEICS